MTTSRSKNQNESFTSYSSSYSSKSYSTKSSEKLEKRQASNAASSNVESEDSFITSSSRLEEKSTDSFSSSLPIDLNGQVNEKSEETLMRPVAPMELLEDSSEMNQKPKFIIGRMQRRASSVSSGTSSAQSSTKTITINHNDVDDKKPRVAVTKLQKREPSNRSSRSSRSSISDFSLVNESVLKNKIADKKYESSSASSVISSVSNSRSNRVSGAPTTNNRIKSAKPALTRKALCQHNRNDENN